jgi:hypothetical protein
MPVELLEVPEMLACERLQQQWVYEELIPYTYGEWMVSIDERPMVLFDGGPTAFPDGELMVCLFDGGPMAYADGQLTL